MEEEVKTYKVTKYDIDIPDNAEPIIATGLSKEQAIDLYYKMYDSIDHNDKFRNHEGYSITDEYTNDTLLEDDWLNEEE